MKRGDLYRVRHPSGDPKRSRVFVIVSRQPVIDSRYSTLICAPIYTTRDGISTQVEVDIREGLKHQSAIHCDGLLSIPRAQLREYVGALDHRQMNKVDDALRIALGLE